MSDTTATRRVFLMLGNQLLPVARLRPWQSALFFLAEDYATCRQRPYHKHKLVFTLAAMRAHADLLRREGFSVEYMPLGEANNRLSFTDKLRHLLSRTGFRELVHFEIEDRAIERRVAAFAARYGIERIVVPTPMFMTGREEFQAWLSSVDSPRVTDFYRYQRRRHHLLVDERGRPLGGRWNLPAGNRSALPASMPVPEVTRPRHGRYVRIVSEVVDQYFPDNPGQTSDFWLPTTRAQAVDWLKDFLEQRFCQFDRYQDALSVRSDVVFHSTLSPLMNVGLLTPSEVISRAVTFANDERIALPGVESFVRQIAGWREFSRGIYHARGRKMTTSNFFGHERRLSNDWYRGTTGIDPLDHVIAKVNRLGWAHHMERQAVVGNLMLLCEIAPGDAYRWFFSHFVDSSHWATAPNVYGLALFADGGTFTDHPYICGSNYLLKMGDYERGPWTEIVDGLFWRFVERHRAWIMQTPGLAELNDGYARLPTHRRRRLILKAEGFLAEKTELAQEVA